ncbi:YkgJ family cysteine cluster protein [Pseudodesulfovibrio cashew]|uniref:YkgJ family cysteine cluster protein n=1 Tax=Pseudodesulfovibrio cashew TaxID=2678688 RepID=A0A6I6JF99_9BACT|nr:YkgJ family cysteine cluster protein [Pseudodesulfovibrio cashew]QGY39760.1 YkgJ family cysteine cluster protein [Pseudodesulfovibrio cashew]
MRTLNLFRGLFRRFRTLVLRREVEIVGQCRLCGNCCHGILLKDRGWLKRKRQFDKLCEREPAHTRFRITGKDHRGRLVFDCAMQGEDNLCTSYGERLPLCRNYPSKSLYYQGGWIGAECGFRFKSVTFRDVLLRRKQIRAPRFSDVLDQERERDLQQADKRTT